MPHITKAVSFTLDAEPTFITPKARKLNSSGVSTEFTYDNNHVDTVSYQIYKELRDFILSVEDLPFTATFEEDDTQIIYQDGVLVPQFSFGDYSFDILCVCRNTDVSYFPYVEIDPYPWVGSTNYFPSYGGIKWLDNSSETMRNSWRAKNDIRTSARLSGVYSYGFTLHLYYNTEYIYIGYQPSGQSHITGLLFMGHLVDRENIDHYLITGCPGNWYAQDDNESYTFSGDGYSTYYSDRFYIYRANTSILPLSGNSCYSNRGDGGNRDWNYTTYAKTSTSTDDSVKLVSTMYLTGSGIPAFINPCATYFTKSVQSPFKDIIYYNNKTDRDVYISNPIVFGGILRFSNQILTASCNIVLDQEYTFNNKNYYCPGDVGCTNFAIPFLLEY